MVSLDVSAGECTGIDICSAFSQACVVGFGHVNA